jgi:kinetochore protein NDC80
MLPRIDSGTTPARGAAAAKSRTAATPGGSSIPPPSGRENHLHLTVSTKPGASSSLSLSSSSSTMIPPPSPSLMASTHASRRRSVGGAQLVAEANQRRQSILMSGGPPLPPVPGGKAQGAGMQEVRPIADKKYQRDSAQLVLEYLQAHQYPYHVALKTLLQPSGRDFVTIVTFLLRQFDPQFQAGDSAMKLEDEMVLYFRELGYPVTMSKTSIVAAGSPHAWPALLAALSWLVHHLRAIEAEADADYLRDELRYPSTGRLVDHLTKADASMFSQYSHEVYLYQQAGRQDLLERVESELVAALERGDEVAATELETLERERDGIAHSIERMQDFHQQLQVLAQKREERIVEVEQYHDFIAEMGKNKLASERHVQDLTDKLEAANAEVKAMQGEIQAVRERVDKQTMTVQDELKLTSHSKELAEAIERAEARKAAIAADLNKEQKELAALQERCEERFQACFQSKIAVLEDKLPAELQSSHKIAQWKKLAVNEVVGNPSVLQEVKSMSVKGKEALENHLKILQESHQDMLDRLEQLQRAMQESRAKSQYWKDKTDKVLSVLEQETQTHRAKLEVRLNETRRLEDKISRLQDPVALETQQAAYERQCAELEAMRARHEKENVERIKKVEDEIVAAVDMMIQHDAFVAAKLRELHEYNQSKLSAAPVLVHPAGWEPSSTHDDDVISGADSAKEEDASVSSSAQKPGSSRKSQRGKQQKKKSSTKKNSRRK